MRMARPEWWILIRMSNDKIKNYNKYMRRNKLRIFVESEIDLRIYKPLLHKEYHYFRKRIDGKKVMDRKKTQEVIAAAIEKGEPFWMARMGHTELNFVNSILFKRYTNDEPSALNWSQEYSLNKIYNNAGFFPKEISEAEKYADRVLLDAPGVDLHATWELHMEDYMIAQYEKDAAVTRWGYIAPYYNRKEQGIIPWSHALKGKKVLVINPFAESIEKQYKENREKIFEKIYDAEDILPEFELLTLKSVQTVADNRDPRFNTWFEALDWMIDECKKIDFDVALIGCGAYGFPLAAAIKRMGKIAIQTCGSTQMIFGVLGQRWTNDSKLMKEVVNDSWMRPIESERPNNLERIEDGCYW